MKSEEALIGDLIYKYGVPKLNVRLCKGPVVNWYYSPDLGRLVSTYDGQNIYVENVRVFDYLDSQSKENLSQLKFWYLYKKYLKELVNTSNFYLADIAKAKIEDCKPWQEEEFEKDFRVGHTIMGRVKRNYEIIEEESLIKCISDTEYYSYKCDQFLTTNPHPYSLTYLKNIKPFTYDDIRKYKREPMTRVYQAYDAYKNKK